MTESSEPSTDPSHGPRQRVLALSTAAFTLLFAVWLMLGMLALPIKHDLGLTDGQLYTLTMASIVSGAALRFHAGVLADRYGGRKVMLALVLVAVVPTACVSLVQSYWQLLLCAVLYGISGNSFSVGIAWNAAWFPRERQGLALGVFGAGNVGAAGTKLLGPLLIALVPATGLFGGAIPGGWRFIPVVYAFLLTLMAAAIWLGAPEEDRTPARGRTFAEAAGTLRHARVWEYSLQYVIVFGAYVAFSGLLPMYYYKQYGDELASHLGLSDAFVLAFDRLKELNGRDYETAAASVPGLGQQMTKLNAAIGLIVAIGFVFPASLLRPVGGWLSDRFGATVVMTGVFWAMLAAGLLLSLPIRTGVWPFTILILALGCGMGVGKAAVFKLIAESFPRDVGAVGGLVGMLGAFGGVFIPLAVAPLQAATGEPRLLFAVLLALTAIGAGWFHAGQVTRLRTVFGSQATGVSSAEPLNVAVSQVPTVRR